MDRVAGGAIVATPRKISIDAYIYGAPVTSDMAPGDTLGRTGQVERRVEAGFNGSRETMTRWGMYAAGN